MTITQTEDSIIFTWNSVKSRTIEKRNIREITSRTQQLPDVDKITVSLFKGMPVKFDYSSVISPVAASAAALVLLLRQYIRNTNKYQKFRATALNKIYTVTNFTLDENYKVFIERVWVSTGHSRVGNVVTFTNYFDGGEEIIITN